MRRGSDCRSLGEQSADLNRWDRRVSALGDGAAAVGAAEGGASERFFNFGREAMIFLFFTFGLM